MIHHLYAELLSDFQQRHGGLVHTNNPANQKAAVIVEIRAVHFLRHVLTNAAYFLQDGWNLYIVHSDANWPFVSEWIRGWNVRTLRLNVSRLNMLQYNELLMADQFWDIFQEEWVLVFQSDSIFCRPVADEFFRYGYIGAPCGRTMETLNGGFSLRHRPLMKRAISECRGRIEEQVEDFFFTRAAALLGAEMPDFETARRFAVESHFEEFPVGIHGTDKYYLPEAKVAELTAEVRRAFFGPGIDGPTEAT